MNFKCGHPVARARQIAEWAINEKLTPIIDRCADMIEEAISAAVQEEREAIAKLVEAEGDDWLNMWKKSVKYPKHLRMPEHTAQGGSIFAQRTAQAIRQRGKHEH